MPSDAVAEVAPLDGETKLEVLSAVADAAKEKGIYESVFRETMEEAVKDAAVAQAVGEAAAEANADSCERFSAAAESERGGPAASVTLPDKSRHTNERHAQ